MSVERAQAEVSRLKGEITFLEGKIVTARSRLQKLEAYIEITNEYETEPADRSNFERRGPAPKVEVFAEAIRRILAGVGGGPMQTADLHQRLLAEGLNVGGSNPVTNLSSILSRSGMFVNDRKLGWSMIKRSATDALFEAPDVEDESRDDGDDLPDESEPDWLRDDDLDRETLAASAS